MTATNATDAPKPDPAKAGAGVRPKSRFVTIGDSDFAANNAVRIQGNQDLFLNTINWLAQQENLISIRPKPPKRQPPDNHGAAGDGGILDVAARDTGAGLRHGVYAWWRKR